jgi:glycosyltransferase involved in cell wall biosynthesis
VICGAIETRKNHVLLLEVWRRLIRERGAAAPKLLILGSPAHGGAEIQRRLAALPELRSHVTMLSGLSSPALRQIMANAEGVLMPSLAEGFGLPVIEALTVGTPVLASDLPSHREVGLDLACYLDPGQPADWVDAIVRLLDEPDFAAALRRRIASYRPMTGASYFARIGEFLAGMG